MVTRKSMKSFNVKKYNDEINKLNKMIAVSYTHLYDTQIRKKTQFGLENLIVRLRNKLCIHSVSYTHLDVYKRQD